VKQYLDHTSNSGDDRRQGGTDPYPPVISRTARAYHHVNKYYSWHNTYVVRDGITEYEVLCTYYM
jgi:hypothetical protein